MLTEISKIGGNDKWIGRDTGILTTFEGTLTDLAETLTIISLSDYFYDSECIDEVETDFDSCIEVCDPIAENCYDTCSVGLLIMLPDPFEDPIMDIECYDECMSGTGCEFTHSETDINTMCDSICIDYTGFGYDTFDECTYSCSDYYISENIDSRPDIALSCDFTADETLPECRSEGINESYIWDGSTVYDIGSFYTNNYPQFSENAENMCDGFPFGGIWINTPDKVGCVDFAFFMDAMCTTGSVESARDVCETVGGTFKCVENDISCEI